MKTLTIVGTAMAVMLAASPQMAAASDTRNHSITNSIPGNPGRDQLRQGQRALSRYITCGSCPFSQGVNDRSTANEVVRQVQGGEIEIPRRHRDALMVFIADRYGRTR